VREIDVTADDLIDALLRISESEVVSVLDSCGVSHLGSHLLVAGIRPVESFESTSEDPQQTLRLLDDKLSGNLAAFFTLSYDFGSKLQRIESHKETVEPDVFLAVYDALIIYDYDAARGFLVGDESRFAELETALSTIRARNEIPSKPDRERPASNFSKGDYVAAAETIREHIRRGDTYQTNLTQQLTLRLRKGTTPQRIFHTLRENHPAPFAAFFKRETSTVVSASPERFFRVRTDGVIEASPIKGTRRRGKTQAEDESMRNELRASEKDRAENTMIVDLVRNDLGRVCEFGSVEVAELCAIEEHPTLFHLVSTVRGRLRRHTTPSEILRAVYPCGSITGAPKIRTMRIIDELETVSRGLSMGAIGVYLPTTWNIDELTGGTLIDTSVAIRTMVIRNSVATFNVGGGVVIDSDPENEYDEAMLKAEALLAAIASA
jgi:para-aminobenzoate synthetase component I